MPRTNNHKHTRWRLSPPNDDLLILMISIKVFAAQLGLVEVVPFAYLDDYSHLLDFLYV